LNEHIVFRQFSKNDATDLTEAGFIFDHAILRKSLSSQILQTIGFEPRKIGLVAYNTQKRRAIGFLLLTEHTLWLYSIKFVFVDPDYRRMGLATGLLNYAVTLAKKRGARKVWLSANPEDISTVNLYKKMGFEIVLKNPGFCCSGFFPNLPQKGTEQLTAMKLFSKDSKNLLYKIYEIRMGKKWIDFFEIDSNNLYNGYSRDFKHFFFKTAFINASLDSIAIVYNRALLSNVNIELFAFSDLSSQLMLEKLSSFLTYRGIRFAKIDAFNLITTECFKTLEKKVVWESIIMGKML
jgi:ribosomal protein S18 acetylase RimI-like enzyme